MSEIETGGPAFPRTYNGDGHNGLDLRDYFAAKAMAALIAHGAELRVHTDKGILLMPARDGVPVLAYQYADSMLAARGKK